ncbi:MAG: CBS domain-containing protein [Myxococcales bacterium]|nr:CBS domain-containing protein [Myxococcales bacterium]HRC54641.1 CBS domain-containing protein [Kofleriaceae bacterium]
MKPRDLSVADLMTTALITVKPADAISQAHEEMEFGVIRHLPVVDDRGHLVGVLSERDVSRALASGRAHTVEDIMVRDMVTTRPETAAHVAARTLVDRQIGSLLVVDAAGKLVGVVTQTDYVELARRALLGLPLERE